MSTRFSGGSRAGGTDRPPCGLVLSYTTDRPPALRVRPPRYILPVILAKTIAVAR